MSQSTITLPFQRPARNGASFGAWLRKAGVGIWQALETAGQRRAERELAQFAALHASQFPELEAYARRHRA
jgi:hypothetical protein